MARKHRSLSHRHIEPDSPWKVFGLQAIAIGVFLCMALALPPVVFGDSDLSYKVSIEGIRDRELKRLLEVVSRTVTLRDKPPVSLSLLQRRTDQDIPLFIKALKSRGFYDARVTSSIKIDVRPIQVLFQIEPGPAYLLKSVDIRISENGSTEERLPKPLEIGLSLGDSAQSKAVLNGKDGIGQWLRRRGFPFPNIAKPKVVVDHAEQTVSVEFQVDPGPHALFGHTEIQGLESVSEAYARSRISWRQGEPFNADLLRETQRRLSATGLFTLVRVNTAEAVDPEGRLPIMVELKERKHRTIKAGISYKTDEGPGGKLSWEHRNLWHQGERLAVEGTVSGIAYAVEGSFRKPEFLRPDLALVLNLRLAEDHPDAFTSRSLESMGQVERMLSKKTALSAGLGFKWQEVDQLGRKEYFSLFSLPMNFDWDTSDDPLDSSRGGRLKCQVTPYRDFSGADLSFIKGYAHYNRYIRLSGKPDLVFALRGTLGAISGADRDEIPADIRFYAGGGGSIRGYAYQSVGPLRENQPIGGRSLAGLSSELRMKVTDTMGFVVFVDGGNAFEAAFPDFDEPLRWGAGLGLRYFTRVGPLRLDIAVPLNKRDEIDDSFQIYVSLGQAF